MNTCCNNIYPDEDLRRWEVGCSVPYYTKAEIDEKLENIDISGDCMSSGDVQNMIDASVSPIEGSVEALSGTVGELSTDMENKADRSEIPSLSGYATEQWVENKGYLTEHQSLENYYTKGEVDNIADTKLDVSAYTPTDLSNYYTKQEIENKHYLTEHQYLKTINNISLVGDGNIEIGTGGTTDLSNYYTKGETNDLLDDKLDVTAYTPVDLSGYATEQWVEDKHYLTQHQSLADYYNKSEVNSLLDDKLDASAYTPTIVDINLNRLSTNAVSNKAVVEGLDSVTDMLINKLQGEYTSTAEMMNTYWTSAETQNAINTATSGIPSSQTIEGLRNDVNTLSGDVSNLYDTKLDASAYTPTDLSNYYTKNQIDGFLSNAEGMLTAISGVVDTKADAVDTYTKTEVDNLLSNKANASDLSALNTTVGQLSTTVENKADQSTTYTKTEVNNIVNNKFWCGTQAEYEALSNKDNNVLYLIHE